MSDLTRKGGWTMSDEEFEREFRWWQEQMEPLLGPIRRAGHLTADDLSVTITDCTHIRPRAEEDK